MPRSCPSSYLEVYIVCWWIFCAPWIRSVDVEGWCYDFCKIEGFIALLVRVNHGCEKGIEYTWAEFGFGIGTFTQGPTLREFSSLRNESGKCTC